MGQTRVYVGPHDEVEVPVLDQIVRRGETVSVTAEQATALDEQPDVWVKPNTSAAREAAPAAAAPVEPPPVTLDNQLIDRDQEVDQ